MGVERGVIYMYTYTDINDNSLAYKHNNDIHTLTLILTHTHITDNYHIYTHLILAGAKEFVHRYEALLWVGDWTKGSPPRRRDWRHLGT